MNIQQAKIQIKNTIVSYFTKDENGEYVFPIERQRPIFLMGPPGIGKTAIMEQISSEMGIGLLSYPMTHHTRDSILGVSYIDHKNYNGIETEVTEYTMSEIVASIYDFINNTGAKEGILFFDEFNCVEESIQPIMLQFLQNKMLGRHRIPDGWIVVTAGNPPEYNTSGRNFDVVTWDRLKRIDVTPDFTPWRQYAYERKVDQSILSYLEVNPLDFYRLQKQDDGTFKFTSARAWEDLSQMITLTKMNGFPVDGNMIEQYIQEATVCAHFSRFYPMYEACAEAFNIPRIIAGNCSKSVLVRAQEYSDTAIAQLAGNEQRQNRCKEQQKAILGHLYEILSNDAASVIEARDALYHLKKFHKRIHSTAKDDMTSVGVVGMFIEEQRAEIARFNESHEKSKREMFALKKALRILCEEYDRLVEENDKKQEPLSKGYVEDQLKKDFISRDKELKSRVDQEVLVKFDNVFDFLERAYPPDPLKEFVVFDFVGMLVLNPWTQEFLQKYQCAKYNYYLSMLSTLSEAK